MAVPNNKNRKKTKTVKKKTFSLDDFKKKTGTENIPTKPLEWYRISQAMQDETGLPGFPKGYCSSTRGFSNTGKSTSAIEAAVAAQKMGDLAIIIDTETNIGKERLRKVGMDIESDFYIYIDATHLLENYTKKTKDGKDFKEPSIEDLGACVNHYLDLQENNELPFDLCFIIDSIGVLDCIQNIKATMSGGAKNNQWNAGAYEKVFKHLLNIRIPNSRNLDKEYTNTLISVNKIWLDAQVGMGTIKPKGGEVWAYSPRLIYHHGGIVSAGVKNVKARSKNKDVTFGTEAKVGVAKNQIDDPLLGGINMDGRLISTPHGFIANEADAIAKYKKEHILIFRNALGGDIDIDSLEIVYETKLDEDTGEIIGGETLG